jgi:hypothetical protein
VNTEDFMKELKSDMILTKLYGKGTKSGSPIKVIVKGYSIHRNSRCGRCQKIAVSKSMVILHVHVNSCLLS